MAPKTIGLKEEQTPTFIRAKAKLQGDLEDDLHDYEAVEKFCEFYLEHGPAAASTSCESESESNA